MVSLQTVQAAATYFEYLADRIGPIIDEPATRHPAQKAQERFQAREAKLQALVNASQKQVTELQQLLEAQRATLTTTKTDLHQTRTEATSLRTERDQSKKASQLSLNQFQQALIEISLLKEERDQVKQSLETKNKAISVLHQQLDEQHRQKHALSTQMEQNITELDEAWETSDCYAYALANTYRLIHRY